MRFRTYIVILAATLMLAACGRVATSNPGAQESPAPQPSATVAASTATPVPHPSATAVAQQSAEPTLTVEIAPQTSPRPAIDTIVIYHKSGGFAGISETMTVYSDGRVELIKRGELTHQMQLQPDELAALKQMLTSSDFTAVDSPTMPPAADAFVYEVTVPSSSGKDHNVKTSDSTQNPAALDTVLEALGQLRKHFG